MPPLCTQQKEGMKDCLSFLVSGGLSLPTLGVVEQPDGILSRAQQSQAFIHNYIQWEGGEHTAEAAPVVEVGLQQPAQLDALHQLHSRQAM